MALESRIGGQGGVILNFLIFLKFMYIWMIKINTRQENVKDSVNLLLDRKFQREV